MCKPCFGHVSQMPVLHGKKICAQLKRTILVLEAFQFMDNHYIISSVSLGFTLYWAAVSFKILPQTVVDINTIGLLSLSMATAKLNSTFSGQDKDIMQLTSLHHISMVFPGIMGKPYTYTINGYLSQTKLVKVKLLAWKMQRWTYLTVHQQLLNSSGNPKQILLCSLCTL